MEPLVQFVDADRISPVHVPAVEWAVEQGLLAGDTSGRLRPREPVERQQLATILWRAAGSPSPVDPDPVDPDPVDPVDPEPSGPIDDAWQAAWDADSQEALDDVFLAYTGPEGVNEADLLPLDSSLINQKLIDRYASSHPDHVFERDGRIVITMVKAGSFRIAVDDLDLDQWIADYSGTGYGLAYYGTTVWNATVGGARITRGHIRGRGETNIGALLVSKKPTLIERVRSTGCRTGLRLESRNRYRYCLSDELYISEGSHNTAMSTHGSDDATVQRCNLRDGTSAAFAAYPANPIRRLTVEETLLNGGSYAIHVLGDKPHLPDCEDVRYRSLRIGRVRHPDGGRYGPVQGLSRLRSTPGHQFDDVRFLDGAPV